jgi:anaerobic dimethyl sulfoxide reductase subunit B (iron-sulfur subunit)
MFTWEKGSFPDTIRVHTLFAPCYHCENPVCVDAANGAMYKEEKYGAVLIDPEKANSIDLRKANEACPYGVIQFDSDAMDATASKCTMCIDRLEQGLLPTCVESCPFRALDFGPLEDLISKYGNNRDLEDVPSSTTAMPAIVFKPHVAAKTPLVPFDVSKALQLLAKRDPLPSIFNTSSDATNVPEGVVGRTKPLLKSLNVKEAMQATLHDNG